MRILYGDDVSEVKPAKPDDSGLSTGYFTPGEPDTTLATKVYAWFLNMVQDELLSALTACGVTPDADDDTQLGDCFNKKMDKSGGTFTGAVTHNGADVFNAGLSVDADDIANTKFDEYVNFSRTFNAIDARAVDPEWTFVSLYGAFGCTTKDKELGFGIPHIPGCRIYSVSALMHNRDGSNAHTVRLRLMQRPHSTTANASELGSESAAVGTSTIGTITILGSTHSPTPSPPSADPYITDSVMTNANNTNSYYALIDVTDSDAISTGVFCSGLRVTYKREQIAV